MTNKKTQKKKQQQKKAQAQAEAEAQVNGSATSSPESPMPDLIDVDAPPKSPEAEALPAPEAARAPSPEPPKDPAVEAERLKEAGNTKFKAKAYPAAIDLYTQAI
ncbi:hypothetical protein EWM64_g10497, partial [Hericium alpestre]